MNVKMNQMKNKKISKHKTEFNFYNKLKLNSLIMIISKINNDFFI